MAIRLSPRRKRRIRHRASVEAQRVYGPALAAARGEAGAARRSYRRAASAARGYTSYGTSSINKQIRQARKMNAGGQVIGELKARRSETQAALPFLLSDAQSQLSEDLASARSNITDARVDLLREKGQNLNKYLNAAYEAKAERIKERREEKADSSSSGSGSEGKITNAAEAAAEKYGFSALDYRTARSAVRNALAVWRDNPKLRKLNPLKDGEDWRRFAWGLDSEYEGVKALAAQAVIKDMLQRKREKRGRQNSAYLSRLQANRGWGG
jgi:hypothetical protein